MRLLESTDAIAHRGPDGEGQWTSTVQPNVGFGHRRLVLLGTALGFLASLAGAFAPDVDLLMIGRVVEGLGFIMVAVAIPTLVVRLAAPADQRIVLTLWSAYMPAGAGTMISACAAGFGVVPCAHTIVDAANVTAVRTHHVEVVVIWIILRIELVGATGIGGRVHYRRPAGLALAGPSATASPPAGTTPLLLDGVPVIAPRP